MALAGILWRCDCQNRTPSPAFDCCTTRRRDPGRGVLGKRGPFDELRNAVAVDTLASKPAATPAWQQFLSQAETRTAADLDQRFASLQRQIRDNGVTYNVYADEDGPQRPWSLDLFPLLIEPQRWAQIEAGVLQRTRLLEQVLADVYGPQQLLKRGLLPPR